jgi:gliding motility-associated-like protein
MRKLFLLLFFAMPIVLFGQNCKIITATKKVCLGNTLLFNVTYDAGFTPVSYAWNFGNSATSTQGSPVYQYPARGRFVPRVTVTFSNASSCTVFGDTIDVVDNPKADFNMSTALTQCFRGNQSCMQDLSSPGLDNAPLTTRLFLFGDGSFYSPPQGGPTNICHNYTNPLGGVYTIVLEVTDANNCISRKEKTDHVTVFAKMQNISFTTTYAVQCNQTPVRFNNTSNMPLSALNSYHWDFGDGNTASSPWTNFIHTYTTAGEFNARLSVIDKNGCRDTFTLAPAGKNYKIDSTIYFQTPSMCYKGNGFRFKSNNPNIANVYWAYYKIGNPNRVDTSAAVFSDSINFNDCGPYNVRMYVRIGSCFTRTDTTVYVYGPKSLIETRADKIINSIQCEVYDTVRFRTPVGDNSCYYGNGSMYRLWDFDDAFAPPCTTDTKNNINVGVNCRYSKDSANVWHRYLDGKDQCYNAKLILGDISRGCFDTSEAALKLTAPDAGWDSTSNPIRPGLTYTPAFPCLNEVVVFDLKKTLPLCGRELAWYMPDSACPNAMWIRVDTFDNQFFHSYNKTCNPLGYVTVGLIIKNGKDKNGKDCYDTAWYHNMFRFFPINPLFSLERINEGCGPWRVKVSMADSIQDSLKRVVINFNAPGGVFTLNYGPNDSIIPSQFYAFTTPGIKRISVTITNTRNCVLRYEITTFFGFARSFKPEKPIVCLNEGAIMEDDVSYFNSIYKYWRDPSRAPAGKEQLYWDFGDGKGFITSGSLPKYKYDRVGNYTVKMVSVDSIGCRDTLAYSIKVKVVDVQAAIKSMQARYLCAPQILPFTDESKYFDSSALYGDLPYDKIVAWNWEFGDNKNNSLVQNPVHDYTANGNYTVKLKIESINGCIDSTSIPIWIDGPRPRFDIVSDTVGCAPFQLVLKNTTGYPLINWVWYFRDQNNAIASTKLDTNVKHIYTQAGIYKIYVVGEDTIFNPLTGQYKTCLASFPDSLNVNSPVRTIRVLPAIRANIYAPDTVCKDEPFDLTARPVQLVPAFVWDFGDGSPIKQVLFPDTVTQYTYGNKQTYRVKLYPLSPGAICVDTAYKLITVSDVIADFDMDQTKLPFIQFQNTSQFAVRYEWDFGHPMSGSKNKSTLENPSHNFIGAAGSFTVCLIAYNAQDCWDSICKITLPADARVNIPNIFTPNNDNSNDAFDIDIVGYSSYDLVIFNRWGNKVFESKKDGFGNDGINWNGNNFNVGAECPEGVYYFVFNYAMNGNPEPKSARGSLTLVRDK